MKVLILVYMTAAVSVAFHAHAEADAAYVCMRADEPIAIDGTLDESAWDKAPVINRFNPYKNNPETLPETTVRMLWDKTHLYVAIDCADTDVWSYSKEEDDLRLYLGDVAEIFIKPNPGSTFHYEFVSAPNGTTFDAAFPSRGAGAEFRFARWDSDFNVKTSIHGTDDDWKDTDTGYTVEMAIPFTAFADSGVSAPGDGWTFGVCRYDYSAGRDQPCLMMTMPKVGRTGFHSYEFYQPMIFSGTR